MKSTETETNRLLAQYMAVSWNWMLKLPVPTNTSWERTEQRFHKWVMAIELADGTMDFRWARLVPQQRNGNPKFFYVILGGLSSGAWYWWAQRWGHINGDKGAVGHLECRDGWRQLHARVTKLLAGRAFGIDLRVGPQRIRQDRSMSVDAAGVPTAPRIRNALRARKKTPVVEHTHTQLSLDFQAVAQAATGRSK